MKRAIRMAALAFVLAGAGILSNADPAALITSTQAATLNTAVFAVEKMTCPACPITVKTAMEGVEGVQTVKIDFEAKTATVVFDPSATTVETIAAASANAGYPATVAQSGN